MMILALEPTHRACAEAQTFDTFASYSRMLFYWSLCLELLLFENQGVKTFRIQICWVST